MVRHEARAWADHRSGTAAPGFIQQALRAGLVDELELHLVPLLLGDGERLLDKLVSTVPSFEQVRAVVGTGVTHLKYRLVR